MSFRDEEDALRAKNEALERELALARAELDEVKPRLAELDELTAALEARDAELARLREGRPGRGGLVLGAIVAVLAIGAVLGFALLSQPEPYRPRDLPPPLDGPSAQQREDARELARRAREALEQGDLQLANNRANEAIESDPDAFTAWDVLAEVVRQRDGEEAERRLYLRCIEEASGQASTWCRQRIEP